MSLPVKCSFCGKESLSVKMMIAGPRDVTICNECILMCVKITMEEALLRRFPQQASETETQR